jgi:HSP20 family molecular chaperone IbpA
MDSKTLLNMKEIAKKILVPATSALAGGLVVVAALKLNPLTQPRHEQLFEDVFKKQQEIHHQFDRMFEASFPENFGGAAITDISKREDDSFVYYDVTVEDLKSTSINTKVEEGYLTISGTIEKKSGDEGGEDNYAATSVFKSSFNRTFSLPQDVDPDKMQMLTEKDKVILKFPKIKA